MSQIPVLLDEDVTALLGESSEEIERSALEMIVLELYRRHDISAGRAAEILGLDELVFRAPFKTGSRHGRPGA